MVQGDDVITGRPAMEGIEKELEKRQHSQAICRKHWTGKQYWANQTQSLDVWCLGLYVDVMKSFRSTCGTRMLRGAKQ